MPLSRSLRRIITALLCALTLSPLVGFAEAVGALPLIQVHGPKFYAGEQEIRLQGSNLGNWLLQEDFMFGLYGTHSQMRGAMESVLGAQKTAAFWDEYENVFFTAKDAKFLATQGYNALRVPLNQNRFEDPNKPGQYDETALRRVDEVIRLCREQGIYVILDLHAVMGGQSREIYADSLWGSPEFWRYADFRQRAADFWIALVKRYKNETAVAGYDLSNEPNTEGRPALLMDWYRQLLPRIRAIDPSHVVWLVADDFGGGFKGLEEDLFTDPQTAFQFHMYPSQTFPIKKMTEYPQTIDGVRYDKAWLRQKLAEQIAFGKRKPVWLGEFGASINRPGMPISQAILNDMLAICDEEGWSWTQWSYKDVGQMGLLSPGPDTPWKRFLASTEIRAHLEKANELFSLRDMPTASPRLLRAKAQDVAPDLDKATLSYASTSAQRNFESILSRQILTHLKGLNEDALRELARSFAFASCLPNIALMDVFGREARSAAASQFSRPAINTHTD